MGHSVSQSSTLGRAGRAGAALALSLVAALSTSAFAQSFVGDWTATAHAPGGDASEAIHVARTGDGYSVTAKLLGGASAGPEAGPGSDIVLDGDHFSYKRSLTLPNGDLEIGYSGVVSGDTFTGDVEIGSVKIPFTGVRVRTDR